MVTARVRQTNGQVRYFLKPGDTRGRGLDAWSDGDESRFLVTGALRVGRRQHGGLPGLRRRLCTNLGGTAVIYLTAVIAVLLFVYLGTALVRPEWF